MPPLDILRIRVPADRRRRSVAARQPGDRRNQPVAAFGDGLDVPGPRGLIAQSTAQVSDASGERGLGNEAPLPDGVDDLVFRDNAAAARRKEDQQVDDLRLESSGRAAVADAVERGFDLPPADVQVREDG
jgi:hypothetical protein